jgi:hypothetical protein
MSNDGVVPRVYVVIVLQAHGVELTEKQSDNATVTIMVKNGLVEAIVLPDAVGRRTLHRLQRKFGIPIHHFYHPVMAPSNSGEEEYIQ